MDQGRKPKRWTESEDAIASQMRRDGKSDAEIGAFLDRTAGSVQTRFYWLNLNDEQKRIRAVRIAGYRERNGRADYVATRHLIHHEHPLRPDPRVLAERAFKLTLAPRDLTAAFFGDPLPGFSALDRR